ncbi:MAG: NAD-binding protein [Burkholderiales bacterium]
MTFNPGSPTPPSTITSASDAGRSGWGVFLLLRRLRRPLAVLISVYGVAVLGFTLIPGVDPQGQIWYMSFLDAFYFVSYLGTTIGLGEVPQPFSGTQRLWATAAIYGTVISWLYAIGALFGVLQDPAFKRIRRESAMERAVRRIAEPFYLICGYDDAGTRVAHELVENGAALVVVDVVPARTEMVEVDDMYSNVPALCADASDPKSLVLAGLQSPHCAGVLALTGEDFVNVKIALTAHLLAPKVPVLCAARDHATHARMAAVGADHIINPFDNFAARVALSLRTPSLHVIYESLTTQRGTAMDEVQQLPHGKWLLCGTGLFTSTLRRQLSRLKIEVVVIDPNCDTADADDDPDLFKGEPTDPAVLEKAGIADAAALVAGTSEDVDNLTIILAARALNKRLFLVARQTQRRNTHVFRASPANLVMLPGYLIAAEVLRVIRAPQLGNFLRQARSQDEAWSAALLEQMREVIGNEIVESWSIELTDELAPSVCVAVDRGESFTLRRVMTRADAAGDLVDAVPLMLQRGQKRELTPTLDSVLRKGDRVLFCGNSRARQIMRYSMMALDSPWHEPAAGLVLSAK